MIPLRRYKEYSYTAILAQGTFTLHYSISILADISPTPTIIYSIFPWQVIMGNNIFHMWSGHGNIFLQKSHPTYFHMPANVKRTLSFKPRL